MDLKEKVDEKTCMWLYQLKDDEYKNFLNKKDIRGTIKQIKSYLSKMINNNFQTNINYNYAGGKTFGRLFANGGIQGLPKIIRGSLLDGIASDIDIVNAHPNILKYVCDKHNITCPNLSYYISERDKILSDMIEEMGISKDQAKEYFLRATNDCKRLTTNFDFLRFYDKEMKKIQKKLMDVKEYQFIHPFTDDKTTNKQGSFINNVMCYYENLILQDTIKFFKNRQVDIFGLFFDGLMIYGKHTEELLDDLNKVIYDKWNYSFKFIYKAHNFLNIPKDFIFRDIIKNYENVKNEFNKKIVKVGASYVDIKTRKILTLQNLKETYLHDAYDENGEQKNFINKWVLNPTQDMIVYTNFCCFPKPHMVPPNEYNLWEPFKYQGLTTEYIRHEEGLEFMLNHLHTLCNHEQPVYDFMLMWLAQMFQYPENKSLCPIFRSGQGSGKGRFIYFISYILGSQKKFLETAQPNTEVWGDFNGKMKDAYLVHLSELDTKCFTNRGVIYSLITDDIININEKGKERFSMNSYHRFIASTNKEFPIPVEQGNRRFVLIECSDENKGNAKYSRLLTSYMNNTDIQRTFYDYLMNYPTKNILTEEDIPITEFHREIVQESRDTIDNFFINFYNDNYDKVSVRLTSHELWDEFRVFCSDSNIENRLNKQQFLSRAGRRKIQGLSNLGSIWFKGGTRVVYEINLTQLSVF